jgi:hypothetical protein
VKSNTVAFNVSQSCERNCTHIVRTSIRIFTLCLKTPVDTICARARVCVLLVVRGRWLTDEEDEIHVNSLDLRLFIIGVNDWSETTK